MDSLNNVLGPFVSNALGIFVIWKMLKSALGY